ncbi:substrate-binding periplasmic protein [Inhella gelatinilytica]|uniref:Transporter substrate-binding domain-containing protein n=1 Tax=Inhella gelatinilytica TaxID=2795030 RepID=A0A931NDM5_9BURK|nr:transporter substrate-binding domain-containing protein [Inhella gelatinilytica]MBH9552395.1 transporter substrate-binding domain-containing protein [Inhella gelatinilytica]
MPLGPGNLGLIRFPRPSREFDPATWYPLQVLRAALESSRSVFQLLPSASVMVQSRTLLELANASGLIDVGWGMTNLERERALLPVRIPLHKGLFGWRVLLVRPDKADAFSQVTRLSDLRRFRLAQAAHWPDTEILRANGLPVVTSSHYESLFGLLVQGKVDAFPRSVAEVWREVGRRGEALAVEPTLALHYRAPIYFFVRRDRPELADALETGLRDMQRSGRFERLFQQQHDADLQRSQLAARHIIELDNPGLPPKTPVHEADLWFRP